MNFQGEPGVPFSLNQIIPFGIQRFSRWLYVLLAALLVLVPLYFLRGLYTDYLWFSSLGFSSVFITIKLNQIILFFIGALSFGILCSLSFYFARRFSWGQVEILMPESTFNFLKKAIILGMALFVFVGSCVFGIILAQSWQTILKFLNSSEFGINDPILNKDCLLYTSPSPRDGLLSRMPSSA